MAADSSKFVRRLTPMALSMPFARDASLPESPFRMSSSVASNARADAAEVP